MVLASATRMPLYLQGTLHKSQQCMFVVVSIKTVVHLTPSQIPLCAEFAQPEILEMLRTILPKETALVCPPVVYLS